MAAAINASLRSLSLDSDINSRLFALLENDDFSGCLKLAFSTKTKDCSTLYIAYAQYRLGKDNDCLKTLGDAADRASLHLKAQALYRLERVAPDQLRSLKSNTRVPNEELDIAVNEAAIAAQHATLHIEGDYSPDLNDASHEELFNYSIYLSSEGQIEEALATLQKAIQTLDALQLESDEYDTEIAPIQAQIAHLTGDASMNDQARTKKSDSSTQFLTGINFLQSENPYIRYKAYHAESKLKPSARLFSYQDRIVAYDKIMTMAAIGMNVKNAVNRYCAKFSATEPERCAALRSHLFSRFTRKSLQELLVKEPENVDAAIALISKTVRRKQGVNRSLEVIERIPYATRIQYPGIIGLWCALSDLQPMSKSSGILEDALKAATGRARIDLLAGSVQRAISGAKTQTTESVHLKELLSADPENVIGQSARAVLQPESARQTLPTPDLSSVDIVALELGNKRPLESESPSRKVKRQKVKSAAQLGEEKKLDPERWLPKRDRSDYKPTKKDKQRSKGAHQGGAVDESLGNQGPASQVSKSGEVPRKKKGKKAKK